MKIKTTKQMRLDELLKYAWDNEIDLGCVSSESGEKKLYLYSEGVNFNHLDNGVIIQNQTFTISTEEELTEETEIHGATLVYYDEVSEEVKLFRYAYESSPTLKHIIQRLSRTVSLAVFRGKQLIWSKDTGIPEEGVIECS